MTLLARRRYSDNLLNWGIVSLSVHVAIFMLFSLNPWPTIAKQPAVYTVSLLSVPPAEPTPESKPVTPLKKEIPKPVQKMKLAEKGKKEDLVEKVKKKPEEPKQTEREKVDPERLARLQEALEEIRRKAALDQIRERLARRVEKEEPPAPPTNPPLNPPKPVLEPSQPTKQPVATTQVFSPAPSAKPESKLNEYYSLLWARIKKEWTIPPNLLKEYYGLETVIVMVVEKDGRIQSSWFEKKSGNALYDQMAMRALKKAEPLPPFPKDFEQNALEIGIRFLPE